jgi:hypothetical protein
VTRSGHFNPVFKDARHAAQRVLSGIASREGGYRATYIMVRPGYKGIRGAPQGVCGTLEGSFTPAISPLGLLDGGMQAHGCRGLDPPCRTRLVRAKSYCSACIHKVVVCGPSTHDDAHRGATGRTAGHKQCRRAGLWQLAIAGVCLHDQ